MLSAEKKCFVPIPSNAPAVPCVFVPVTIRCRGVSSAYECDAVTITVVWLFITIIGRTAVGTKTSFYAVLENGKRQKNVINKPRLHELVSCAQLQTDNSAYDDVLFLTIKIPVYDDNHNIQVEKNTYARLLSAVYEVRNPSVPNVD